MIPIVKHPLLSGALGVNEKLRTVFNDAQHVSQQHKLVCLVTVQIKKQGSTHKIN